MGIAVEAVFAIISAIVGTASAVVGVIVPAVQVKRAREAQGAANAAANAEAARQAIMTAQIQADAEVAAAQEALNVRNSSATTQLANLAKSASTNKTAIMLGGSALAALVFYKLTTPKV